MATMMHCAVVEKFSAPLVLRERSIPTPGPGQRRGAQSQKGESHHLIQPRSAGRHRNPGHFSMKIPGQLSAEINTLSEVHPVSTGHRR